MMAARTRALVRAAFILIFTAVAVVINAGDLLLPWHPFSTFGFAATFGGQVTSVDAVAARAGLQVGDHIDIKRLSPFERLRIGYLPMAPEGAVLRLSLPSRQVTLSSHPRPRSLADNVTDIVAVLALLAYLAIAATLVLLRPTPVTWAFYIFSYWFCAQGTLALEYAAPVAVIALTLLSVAAHGASPFGLIVFSLRFPDVVPRGTSRLVERVLIFGIAPLVVLFGVAVYCLQIFAGDFQPLWFSLSNRLADIGFAAGVITLLVRYATADPHSRNRLQWIVAAFSVAFLPALLLFSVLNELGIFPPVWIINCIQTWEVLAPLAVAYTVLRHRLFDIRLVFSRALLYALLTSATVGVLTLVDWAFGRWLAESRFALVGELALALLLGVAITLIHRRIEHTLNRVIFRAQVIAMEALRRFGHEVDLIADPQRLLMQTFEALNARLECDYICVYTIEGASFALATPASASVPGLFPNDDFAVLRMRRWAEPFECDEPRHPLRAALLLPMTARTQLVGFIVCGPKRDRTHYLPEEIETLGALAHRTGAAYAWLTLRQNDPALPRKTVSDSGATV